MLKWVGLTLLLSVATGVASECPEALAKPDPRSALQALQAFDPKAWPDEKWEDRKAALRQLMADVLATDSVPATAIREVLQLRWLAKITKETPTASILFGNASEAATAHLDMTREVMRRYAEKFFVFYDADSSWAWELSTLAGRRAVGITAFPERAKADGSVIAFTNPYLRMRAFKYADRVVIGRDSVVGMGLLINGDVTHVWDPEESWHFWPVGWDWHVKPNLGLKYPHFPKVIGKKMKVGAHWQEKKGKAPEYDERTLIEDMLSTELLDVRHFALVLTEGRAKLETLPDGAVIFGAGVNHPEFTDLVYDASRVLARFGVPIVTGGAGGYMEVANAAAFDAGADSVGIPFGAVGGKGKEGKPEHEKETMVARHTLTVETQGYESRIPLLLHRRPLIVVAPGGSGTAKEIATVFVQLGAEAAPTGELVFLSGLYYGAIVHAVRNAALPRAFERQLRIVDRADTIRAIAEEIARREPRFRRTGPITPRNASDRFVPRKAADEEAAKEETKEEEEQEFDLDEYPLW